MSVTHTLPVSYRPVSVSELLSRQHLACVSNLSWSTNQQRAWAKEAELSLPGHRALPRVNLLLIGCLREGRGGEWRLPDASGSVRCEDSWPACVCLWSGHCDGGGE
ncbi:CST complex subunit CTC1-like isoform X2 [Dicentrarchus labrax]|uniref:CST complex subunit CTC1-like isoform X2 n=1 Tax=Dicentrarchus labrax TaxID=13489 RepID=UPI0021F5673F|nr:CST complex subunit CTC1-like isoform X2 [Dicentrarchus labrax]XP_051249954.1 CST complex subunit CTC1-like isoform X2 [Dicentrarchus labrax]XP_051249956.1 CST complex subunit CTC1-like isoform X2 [Dicentrarchus labrax]XP_051249957.1 CST complex subunit CTC1-like isoform X2 [Dicentrarchus labrax]XP_051249958.1 CST complex subunit CTC1-like isoform X2 [Dicentrarchus labrax]XP_051249959.1 CST complex subunit CTC1-like isoform X2 [Dicentrarchus labrax]XP_051249960.1 CST complex subunit CTC1-l